MTHGSETLCPCAFPKFRVSWGCLAIAALIAITNGQSSCGLADKLQESLRPFGPEASLGVRGSVLRGVS